MSTGWSVDELLSPRTPEAPAGENLEDTPLLTALDRFGVFGRHVNYVEHSTDESVAATVPEWSDVRASAIESLGRSKDLRALTHLGAASLWTDGLASFVDSLVVAATWLENEWAEVFPRLDEDAMVRQSALLCFGDPIAILNRLRRVPLARGKLGEPISLRDTDIAAGQLQPVEGERTVGQDVVDVTFADAAIEDLQRLIQEADRGVDAVTRIENVMGVQAGPEWTPDLKPLSSVFITSSGCWRRRWRRDLGIAPKAMSRVVSRLLRAGPSGWFGRARTPFAPWRRWRRTSGKPSRRARCLWWLTGRSVWCRRTSSKSSRTWRPMLWGR
jgi:hypothetical protein